MHQSRSGTDRIQRWLHAKRLWTEKQDIFKSNSTIGLEKVKHEIQERMINMNWRFNKEQIIVLKAHKANPSRCFMGIWYRENHCGVYWDKCFFV